MIKRIVEIEDDLEDREENIKEEIKENFLEWVEENPDSDFDEYYQNEGADFVHECVDRSTPIYDSDINGLYYLYGDKFEEVYEKAGLGTGSEANHKQVAIYCYLENVAYEYQEELRKAFDDWRIGYKAIDGKIKDENIGKSEEEIDKSIEQARKESVKEFIKTMKE